MTDALSAQGANPKNHLEDHYFMQKKQYSCLETDDIDTDEITLFLSGVSILQDLDEDIIINIAQHMNCQGFASGDYLISKGVLGTQMYIVWRGTVVVNIGTDTGRQAKQVVLGRGDVIGEIALLSGNTYSATVVAKSDVLALTMERHIFLELIGKYRSFAGALTQLMSKRLIQNDGIQQVEKYKLLGKIGEGGMAMVYNAFDPDLEREVAIKMLKYQIAARPGFLESFSQEAKTIASLNHPNIVSVLDIIDAYSTRFIVMEKVNGINLRQHLQQFGPFDPIVARKILCDLAQAIEYAHCHGENGVVHRDIKPSNVIIDSDAHVKLMDFGIAGPPTEHEGIIGGTPYYMSPEIIRGHFVDGKADIYALGVMAFQMVTGRPPFMANSSKEILYKHVNESAPRVQKFVSGLPIGLANFINGALIKDPEKRLSNWKKIQYLLGQEEFIILQEQHKLSIDEVGVFIRLKGCSDAETKKTLTLLKTALTQRNLNFTMETLLPNNWKNNR